MDFTSKSWDVSWDITLSRTLVLQSRSKKGWNVFPLKSKETIGKRGAGGPESKAEVEPILRDKLKRGCLLAADGSPAFQSAAKTLKIPSLKGVSHLKKVFTPVSVLPKKNLGAFAHRTLHKATLGSKPTTKENTKDFKAVAGDNAAEGRLGHVKNTMRRQNALGRQRKRNKAANVQVLAAAALHRQAGLKTVLTAMKEYRQACSTGTVRITPAECYDETKVPWLPWRKLPFPPTANQAAWAYICIYIYIYPVILGIYTTGWRNVGKR